MNLRFAQTVVKVLSFSNDAGDSDLPLRGFSESEWQRNLPWLDLAGVALFFWQRVRQMGLENTIPFGICSQLDRREGDNRLRTAAMTIEWKQLNDMFNSQGIRCLTLKGLATIPDYCADPVLRLQFDHDFLVDENCLGTMDEALRSAGYRRKNLRVRDRVLYVPDTPAPSRFSDPFEYYSLRLQRPIELHFKLWDAEEEGFALELPRDLFANSTTRRWSGYNFSALSDEDALLFEALHAFRHITHNWCRLSVLFEIGHFLDQRRGDRAFWARFCGRVEHDGRLRRLAGVVFTLAARVFGISNPLPDFASEFLAIVPALQLWVNRQGEKSALANFASNKSSLFLLGEFIDDRVVWRGTRRRRLFPMQLPNRRNAAGKQKACYAFLACCKLGAQIIQRSWFHLWAAFRYGCEYPLWHVLVRHARDKARETAIVADPLRPKTFGRGHSSRVADKVRGRVAAADRLQVGD
jgi:hypothetical protein